MVSSCSYNKEVIEAEARKYEVEITENIIITLLDLSITKWKRIYDCHVLSVTKEECPNIIHDLKALDFRLNFDGDNKYVLAHKTYNKLYIVHVW